MSDLIGRLTAFAGITPDSDNGFSRLNPAARSLILEAVAALGAVDFWGSPQHERNRMLDRIEAMVKALQEAIIKVDNDRTMWTPEWQIWLADARAAIAKATP